MHTIELTPLEKSGLKVSCMLSRLNGIAKIIETVDNRCLAADGPVTPTLSEMTQAEISEIYKLSKWVAVT